MKYAVSEEGVSALHAASNSIQNALESIEGLTGRIRSASGEHSGVIGPHEASLEEALEQIEQNIKTASGPAEEVAEKLDDVADGYEEVIGNDRFGNNAASVNSDTGGSSGATQGKSGGIFSRIFGGGQKSSSSVPTFGSFETGKMENGSNVIKGEHFEQFKADYYSSENSIFEKSEGLVVETISPSNIEGIHLDDREINDPSVFWGMHNSSKEFFEETASHIPEVQSAINNGRTIDDLRNDPVLGTCTSIYFDPQKIPRVEKNDGYYTFDGDGRHRIIAAREFGYNIPVRIVGVRSRLK